MDDIDLPAVRMLHDRLGAEDALEVLTDLQTEPSGLVIECGQLNHGWWGPLFRRTGLRTLTTMGRRVHMSFDIDPRLGILYLDGRLNMKVDGGVDLPETVWRGLAGSPAATLIDHPYLDGLTIDSVEVGVALLPTKIQLSGAVVRLQDCIDAMRLGNRP